MPAGFALDWWSFGLGLGLPAAFFAGRGLAAALRGRAATDTAPRGLKVVITGGSRGLGYALADRFLALGDSVVLASRSAEGVAQAERSLRQKHPAGEVHSMAVDVAQAEQQDALARLCVEKFGRLDIWVANAALSQGEKLDIADTPPEAIASAVATNLTGSIFSARAAMKVMRQQPEGGKLFLVDGTGAWGNATPGNVAYGATKRGLTQLVKSLEAETKKSCPQVKVHICSPGMMVTDLLKASGAGNLRALKFFNILAELPNTTADWLVPRMRGVTGTGKYFKFLTPLGVAYRFATAASRKNRFFDIDKLAAEQAKKQL